MNDETGVLFLSYPMVILVIRSQWVMEFDRLNNNNDPFPDGIFDFVPGVAIDQKTRQNYIPCSRTFGSNLRKSWIRK